MNVKIEYTDDIKEGFGGITTTPSIFSRYILRKETVIKIRPKYFNDKGLLNHELKHVEQFNKHLFYNIRYRFIKSFRYQMELEAYTEQIKAYNYKSMKECEWIIEALLNKYSLDVSRDSIVSNLNTILIKINLN